MKKILIIEDDYAFAKLISGFLTQLGYVTEIAKSAKDANALSIASFDLILLDYRLPDAIGLDVLMEWRANGMQIPVIIMTSFNDVATAVRAIKAGAKDYITKPINHEELRWTIEEVFQRKENVHTKEEREQAYVIGISEAAIAIQQQISLVGPTELSVLILGESGTGKENVARTIHSKSTRNKKPFIAVDCGTLTSELAKSELFGHKKGSFTGAVEDKVGKFELANGGTIFLDEIGNLSYDVQVMLLRALQERVIQPVGGSKEVKVDVRVIAATNENLLKASVDASFREDLYHRLNEFSLKLPALRDRKDDIPLFVNFFIDESNTLLNRSVQHVEADAERILLSYSWPGNIRELRNVIRRAVLLSSDKQLRKVSLPTEMFSTVQDERQFQTDDLKLIQEQHEKEMIKKVLLEVKYNKTKAARQLNIDRSTLYAKMLKYGIE